MLKTIFEDKLFESILDLGIELLIWFIFLTANADRRAVSFTLAY